MYGISVDLLGSDLESLLGYDYDMCPNLLSAATHDIRLLQHFQASTSVTLGGNDVKRIMHAFVANRAWQHAHLMHMTLALSAAHLRRLYAASAQEQLQQQSALAEATHWQEGLQIYQKEIQASNRDFDAMVATTFLTIIFTFALDDNVPVNAYETSNDDSLHHAISPMAATGGFRALRHVFGEFMNDSVWKTVLIATDDEVGTFTNNRPRTTSLPFAFIDLCDLDEASNSENKPYHKIIRHLTPLLQLEPSVENFGKFFAFSGRTWPEFQALLLRRDPRGLLLASYWFALLRQIDQWWLTPRAKSECVAIVTYLLQLQDTKIAALLPFPASFGQADISYIWDPPCSDQDTPRILNRYFQVALRRTIPHPRHIPLSSKR